MFDCHYQKWDSLKSIWLLILDSVSCGLGWYWGFGFGVAFFYSWLGMSSIQHEIFIESIYNNQKLSILREYSITSCDHQTIFSCFYSPFYRSVWRLSKFWLDESRSQSASSISVQSRLVFYNWNLSVSRVPKNIFDLGTRQNFYFYIRFSRQWGHFFRKLKFNYSKRWN